MTVRELKEMLEQFDENAETTAILFNYDSLYQFDAYDFGGAFEISKSLCGFEEGVYIHIKEKEEAEEEAEEGKKNGNERV